MRVEPHEQGADPVLYRVTYRPETGRHPETVEADRVDVEAQAWVVLRSTVLVIGRPREIVTRRLRATDVLSVDELPTAPPATSDTQR